MKLQATRTFRVAALQNCVRSAPYIFWEGSSIDRGGNFAASQSVSHHRFHCSLRNLLTDSETNVGQSKPLKCSGFRLFRAFRRYSGNALEIPKNLLALLLFF